MNNQQTLDWHKDLNQILESLQKTTGPFKVASFFKDLNDLPKSNSDFVTRFPNLPILTVSSNQTEFIQAIREGNYQNMARTPMTLKDYYKTSLNDEDFFENIKCYEDYVPEAFVSEVSKAINLDDLKKSCDSFHSPDFYYRFFYGLEGQETAPHLDWSPFNSILFQIYGKKEIILFSPEHFSQLPFVYNYIDLSVSELIDLAETNNVPYQVIEIDSGEGLYIPPYYAHAVRYLTDSSSLSLRLLPQKKRGKIHQYLPANWKLAKVLHENTLSDIDVEELITFKDYQELIKIYGTIDLQDPASLLYEESIFLKKRTFDYQIDEKKRRSELLKRGPAYFSSL